VFHEESNFFLVFPYQSFLHPGEYKDLCPFTIKNKNSKTIFLLYLSKINYFRKGTVSSELFLAPITLVTAPASIVRIFCKGAANMEVVLKTT
jgi:hypothetical protein